MAHPAIQSPSSSDSQRRSDVPEKKPIRTEHTGPISLVEGARSSAPLGTWSGPVSRQDSSLAQSPLKGGLQSGILACSPDRNKVAFLPSFTFNRRRRRDAFR